MSIGKANDILNDIFKELLSYTQTHFAREENLFKLYKLPQADSHQNEHALLIKQASDLQTKFKTGMPISTSTANFLKGWLTNHIMKSDKAYSAFLQEKGVK
jgi:hemerythrin-like metal-binding protein